MADTQASQSRALGDFLRARRERLDPASLGFPSRRRRTPGLRREEVASLAGIGVDWYIRLEQGRSTSPSLDTVDALAKALRLGESEHAHMRTLARADLGRVWVRERVPEPIRRMVEGLKQPAYVTGRRWDVLAWNRAADDLMGFGAMEEADRNTLLLVLVNPRSRQLFAGGWEAEAKRIVAQFRATHDLWTHDPSFRDLLDRLHAGCPEFARWWRAHDVRPPRAGVKVMHHPKKGVLRFEHTSFQANDDPSLRLVILSPAPPRTA